MSTAAIVLVLFSALIHAGWNLLGKRDGAEGAFYLVACLAGGAALLPVVLAWSAAVARMPPAVWALLVPAGMFQALYFVGLAGSYRTGDLSVAYPVARAVPVVLVPLLSTLLRQGEPLSPPAVAGMVAVAAGLLVIPQHRLLKVSAAQLRSSWMRYAVLAGIGTAGYSLVDDAALALFRAALTSGPAAVQAAVIYSAFESFSTAVFLLAFGALRLGAAALRRSLRDTQYRSAAIAGVAIVAAYCLVLAAYGFARNVAYVVAFRQVSLPLGAMFGVVFLGERMSPARFAGAALIVGGLILVGLG